MYRQLLHWESIIMYGNWKWELIGMVSMENGICMLVIKVLALCLYYVFAIWCAKFPSHTLHEGVGGTQQPMHQPSQLVFSACSAIIVPEVSVLLCSFRWCWGWGGRKGKILPFCFKLWQQNMNPVVQFMDIRILQKILWTLRLVFLCALSIPSTRLFLTTILGQTGVLFSICWKKSYRYYGHLVIAYWTYKTLSKRQSSFPRFFVGGWKNQTLSPLSASLFDLKCMPFEAYVMVDTELWYDANGLPGYKHIKPCLLAGFLWWIHEAIFTTKPW